MLDLSYQISASEVAKQCFTPGDLVVTLFLSVIMNPNKYPLLNSSRCSQHLCALHFASSIHTRNYGNYDYHLKNSKIGRKMLRFESRVPRSLRSLGYFPPPPSVPIGSSSSSRSLRSARRIPVCLRQSPPSTM